MDADGRIHPRVAVGQLQHFGGIARVGGLLTDAHHALIGQAVQQGVTVGVKGMGAVMRMGIKNRAHQRTPFWAGALFTSQMPTQTKTSAPRYCQRNSGSPLSRALSSTLTTGFISRAQMT